MTDIERKSKQLKKIGSSVISKEWLERTIISLGLYGKISGVIGPYIIANVNSKMIIRLRPKDFKMSQTEASIKNRDNMAAANKFALFLKSIDIVYKTWGIANLMGNNPFTRIIKYNKKYLVNDSPSLRNTLTPDGFQIYIENKISADMTGRIKITKDYIADENEKLVVVLAATDPKRKGINSYECIELNSAFVKPGKSIELKDWQKALCSNYKKFIIYSAVIRFSEDKVRWSNTCALEAAFNFEVDYQKAEHCGYGQIQPAQIQSEIHYCYNGILINSKMVIKPPGILYAPDIRRSKIPQGMTLLSAVISKD